MAGFFSSPRAAVHRSIWPRDLQRAALLLGASAALFWCSFGVGRWIVSGPGSGAIYVDLLLAWIAVLVHIAAWPALWAGLQNLRDRQPAANHAVVAWRSFLLTLGLVLAAVVVLPLQYHSLASRDAWILVLYVSAFPFVAWTFVPILALHGILFGRVANFLEPRSRRFAIAGVVALFAVAGATTAIIFHSPGVGAFAQSWSIGRGILPATALAGYVLIAFGITAEGAGVWRPLPSWERTTRRWAPRRAKFGFTRGRARGRRLGLAHPRARWRNARVRP